MTHETRRVYEDTDMLSYGCPTSRRRRAACSLRSTTPVYSKRSTVYWQSTVHSSSSLYSPTYTYSALLLLAVGQPPFFVNSPPFLFPFALSYPKRPILGYGSTNICRVGDIGVFFCLDLDLDPCPWRDHATEAHNGYESRAVQNFP